jgi:hypothetical protein
MREPALDEPVIVLTGARSGSTLLRQILDTHPDLACPPETNIVKTCAQIAGAFGATGEYAGDDLPAPAREAIQDVVARLFGDYLSKRGKVRWCDKSLGTAPFAEWLLKLYPKARFVCLYRHCMDVVHSGLEASPWGLVGYGFEQFAGVRGTNSVSALTAYWVEHTRRIREFERAHADRCVRVNYERLVADPEATAAEVFAALGARPEPGITARCFGGPPSALGPGDHKIRATGRITADSVGRGVRIPVGLIPAAQLIMVNHLLTDLGYTPVDDAWRDSPYPPVLLAGADGDRTAGNGGSRSLGGEVARTLLEKIGDVFYARMAAGLPRIAPPDGAGTFDLVAYHADEHRLARCWRVRPAARTVTEVEPGADPGADWLVTGDVETWLAVLADRVNMSSCVRSGALRYIAPRDGRALADAAASADPDIAELARSEHRLALVRRLLGLAGYAEEVAGRDELPLV